MSRVFTVLLAGGSGTRMGAGINKVFLPLAGISCIRRSISAFEGLTDGMVLVHRPEDASLIRAEAEAAGVSFPVSFVSGGATRQRSVLSGLLSLTFEDDDIVLIHDGARCLVSQDVIRGVIVSCREYGSGVASVPVTDTIRAAGEGSISSGTLDRSVLRAAQTPQGFLGRRITAVVQRAESEGFTGTDDASLMERYGFPVRLTPGDRRNLKITTREDIMEAEAFLSLSGGLPDLRVGTGYDVHRLVEGRPLILCGVEIPHDRGLLGHSDADVALHALMDAMLGAAALGDIGQHFPDTDPRYSGISSLILLGHTVRLLSENGFAPVNADITIAAQKPKLMPFIPQMRANTARVCGLPVDRVSVKATTTEKLGFEGRMEGISAQAVCLIRHK